MLASCKVAEASIANRRGVMAAPVEASVAVTRRASFETRGAANDNAHLRLVAANGNLTAVTDGLNQTGSLSYDALDRQTGGTDPLLGQTVYSYDANDNLTQVRDPRNLATGYGYDSMGNCVGQNSPDTAASTFLYDDAGNVTQSTDAAGRVQTYQYDALNRLTVQTATGLPNTVFSYDVGTNGKGRLTGLADMSGTMSWTYDGLGRLLTQVQSMPVSRCMPVSRSVARILHPSVRALMTWICCSNGRMFKGPNP